jgi:hypothetical protein
MWQGILRALDTLGLVIGTASEEEGRLITEFTPLDPGVLATFTLPEDREQSVEWTGAEYRYEITIGSRADRIRISVRAELRGWAQEDLTTTPRPEAKRVLRSNRLLEREFLTAFTKALGEGAVEEETLP